MQMGTGVAMESLLILAEWCPVPELSIIWDRTIQTYGLDCRLEII